MKIYEWDNRFRVGMTCKLKHLIDN